MQPTLAPLTKGERFTKTMRRHWMLYVMIIPVLLYYIVFHYLPMFGIIIAFQDFRVTRGFFGSIWV